MEEQRGRALGSIALDAQIRRQERADGVGQQGKLAGVTVTSGRSHSSLRSPATPVEARI